MHEENVHQKQHGALESIAGRIKRAFGTLMGHERTEAEGRAQELHGRERVEQGRAAERGEGAAQELAGEAKGIAGDVTGSERLQAEGRAEAIRGRERQDLNR